MKAIRIPLAAFCALVSAAVFAAPANQIPWLASVTDGDYSSGASWDGGTAPLEAGKTATFDLPSVVGTVRAHFPAALTECAMTYVKEVGPLAKLVLDATGTTWTKGPGAYAAADQAFTVTDNGTAILTVGGVDTTGATGVFTFEDGLMGYDGETKTFTVESGAWDLGSRSLTLGNVNGAAVELAGGAVTADALTIGDKTDLNITGGTHVFSGAVTMGKIKNYTSRIRISGGKTTVGGTTSLITNGSGNDSRIDVLGDGAVTFGAMQFVYTYTGSGTARLNLSETAKVDVTGSVTMNNNNGNAYVYFDFAGNSTFKHATGKTFSSVMGLGIRQVYMTIRDNAFAEFYNLYVGAPATSGNVFNLLVTNNAQVVISEGGSFKLGNGDNGYQDSFAEFAGKSRTLVKGDMYFGNNASTGNGGIVRVKDDAELIGTSSGKLLFGQGGGAHGYLEICDNARVVVTNTITLYSGIRANESAHFRLLGGELVLGNWNRSSNYFTTPGQAEILANGGTLKPLATCSNILPNYFDSVTLEGEGLTIDSDGNDIEVNKALTGTKFTKAGVGTLTVKVASEHDETAVRGGTLKFAAGVTRFGKTMAVAGGTVSTAGDATGFSCDALTLGDETAAGVLEVDGSDVVTVADGADLTIVNGQVCLPDAETLATISFLKVASGTVDAAALEHLSVNNALLTREYEFKAVQGDDGVMIQVEIKELSSSDVTWTGATDGDWSKSANWIPTKVPTISANATFPYAASHKEVEINSDAAALKLTIESDYDFSGDGALMTPEIALAEGVAASFANPIEMPSDSRLTVPADSELTLGGALTTAASTQTAGLLGEGRLKVSGDNAGFIGGWNFLGSTGTVEFASANAAGTGVATMTAMSVGPMTVRFSGETAAVTQPLTLDPGSGTAVSILAADSDATLQAGFTALSGAFAKIGTGTLAVNFPAGKTYQISKSSPDTGVVNRGPTNAIKLPENGSGITSGANSGFASVNVLDGEMVISGGANVSVKDAQKFVVIGGNYSNGTENAVLRVKNVSLSLGAYDNPTTVGNCVPEGAMRNPALVVTDGAAVTIGELALGAQTSGRVTPFYPTLAVTNATVQVKSRLDIGPSRWYPHTTIHPVVRIGPGGKVGQISQNVNNQDLNFSRNVDVVVDAGELYDYKHTFFGFGNGSENYSGTIKMINGGKLSVCDLRSVGSMTDKSLMTEMIFDGGVLKLKSTSSSYVADPANVKVTTCGAGMEVQVASGITHQFAIPITGAGGVVKTGAGTLVLTNRAEDVLTTVVAFSGPLTVSEGVVDFCGADLSSVGAVSGAGTVRNATGIKALAALKDATADTLTTFEDAAFATRVKVDFSGSTWTKGETVPVLKIGSGAMPNLKAVNVGDKLSAVFAVLDGVVWATVCDAPGLMLLVK